MEEKLYETLKKLGSTLHYLGKYDEANAVIWLAVELQRQGVEKVQDLDYVGVTRKEIK